MTFLYKTLTHSSYSDMRAVIETEATSDWEYLGEDIAASVCRSIFRRPRASEEQPHE